MRNQNRLSLGKREPSSGLQVGPISKKMLRDTNSLHGRYTIYTVILCSLLGVGLKEGLGVPYEISVLVIAVPLAIALICMNRIIAWVQRIQKERFQERLAQRQKDRDSV